MVYVELRARCADWRAEVHRSGGGPPRSMDADKALRHMVTPHENPLSYMTTGQLRAVIRDEINWPLFEGYFPPDDIFDARFKEVAQIRHRVAHFREAHATDLERVTLFLRDIDKPIWKFCTSYCGHHDWIPPGITDPVSQHFIDTHRSRGIVEMEAMGAGWLYADERENPRIGFRLTWSVRPWSDLAGKHRLIDVGGLVYHATVMPLSSPAGGPRMLEVGSILDRTRGRHPNCIHIRLESDSRVEITVPAVLGEQAVIETVEGLLDAARSNVRSGRPNDVAREAASWPEYVLGPRHPLGFLSSDMPCTMFVWD